MNKVDFKVMRYLCMHGASSIQDIGHAINRGIKKTRAILSRLVMEQIVEYDQTTDLWNLFCPADWFGDKLNKEYNSKKYKYLNRLFLEKDDGTNARCRLDAKIAAFGK